MPSPTFKLNRSQLYDFIFLLLVAAIMFYGRWASIVFPYPLNPDEAQAAANALRLKAYGFSWNALDGTTVGPLNTLILSWPYLFGFDVTLSTARLTAGLLLFIVVTGLYLTISKQANRTVATLLTLPLVVFYGFTENQDFLHYSSELFPVSLLIIANLIAGSLYRDSLNSKVRFWKVVSTGLLIGAAPFAKLQSVPIAFIIALFVIYSLIKALGLKKSFRFLLIFSISAAVPFILLLIPLIASNTLRDFYKSYISWPQQYIGKLSSILTIHKMIAYDNTIKPTSYFIMMLTIFGLISRTASRKKTETSNETYDAIPIYYFLLLIAALFAVARPGQNFQHYLMLLIPFLVPYAAWAVSDLFTTRIRKAFFFSFYLLTALFLINQFWDEHVENDVTFETLHTHYQTELPMQFELKNPALFSWLPIKPEHMFIWGWMPEWYLLANITPAARETHTYAQITKTKLSRYFRKRMMKDLNASSPELIIDATNGNAFHFKDPAQHGPAIFSNFHHFLNTNYSPLESPFRTAGCQTIYLKNEIIPAVKTHLVFPATVIATDRYVAGHSYAESSLFDLSMTEDVCSDYWLLPDKQLGAIDIGLEKLEYIKGLLVLNTGNSIYLDRASNEIKISLLDKNKTVHEENVFVRPYPYFTDVTFEHPKYADSIRIEILSYHGRGAGLNEVLILRDNTPKN